MEVSIMKTKKFEKKLTLKKKTVVDLNQEEMKTLKAGDVITASCQATNLCGSRPICCI